MEFCQDAQFKLEAIPSSTVEYVESLTFLDDIQEKVSTNERLNVHRNMSFCRRKYFITFQQHTIYDGPGNDRNHSLRPVPQKGENGKARTMPFSFVGSLVISSVQCYSS